MSIWDRLNEWLTAAIVASLTWVSGIVSPGLPPEAPTANADPGSYMLGWAQEVEQPPIEQVGEGTGDDVETLDEGTLPVEDAAIADPETLDAGAPPAAQDGDVELLDQGAPPATAGQPVETVYVAPAAEPATYVAPEPAPVVATGPVLPEGFGTGQVYAVAGRSETPIGLAECHVGAVTGRAFVGLDCGEDEGTSFVGHAPSFESFPFVLEAEFPFEGDEAFFTDPNFPFGDEELAIAASRDESSDTDVFVSARGEQLERDDEASTTPAIETGGESSVAFAQRAREREPRVRVENRDRRGDKGKNQRARAEADDGGTRAESQNDNRRNDAGESDRLTAEGEEKDKKKAKDKKNDKEKKDRAEREEKKKRNRDRR